MRPETKGVHDRYSAGSTVEDLHEAVEAVRAWRSAQVGGSDAA